MAANEPFQNGGARTGRQLLAFEGPYGSRSSLCSRSRCPDDSKKSAVG